MICLTGRSDMTLAPYLCRGSFDVCQAANDLGLYKLDIQGDGHLVANKNATGLKRRVPGQAVIFAVDLCCRRDRNSGIAPRILGRRGWPFSGKDNLARDAANGQVALDSQLSVPNKADARGLERQRRELLHVQEVLALQVRVALSIARLDRGSFDCGLDT